MKTNCHICSSWAINHHSNGRDGSDGHLCDVCYWRKRAEHKRLTDVDAVAVKHGTKLEDAEGCEYRFDAEDLGAFVREILGVKE